MKSLTILLTVLIWTPCAYCADPQCVQIMEMASEFITCSPKGSDELQCSMSSTIMTQDIKTRSGMIHAIADADACITGRPRYIEFKFMGDLVGKASPASGISVYK